LKKGVFKKSLSYKIFKINIFIQKYL